MVQVRNLSDFIAQAKAAGFWVYGAEATGSGPYDAVDYRGRTLFVVGSEGEGLGERVSVRLRPYRGDPVGGAGRVAQCGSGRGGAALRGGSTEEGRLTVYIIDGYNVLHELRRHQGKEAHGAPLDSGALADERARLLDRIASLMGGTDDRALVVFDSHTATLQKVESATPSVEVYFGSLERSADAIIERTAYVLRAAENVVVVTSDFALQKTVFAASVTRRSSRQFVDELQAHTRKVAISTDCTRMVHRVEERIDASEPGAAQVVARLPRRGRDRPGLRVPAGDRLEEVGEDMESTARAGYPLVDWDDDEDLVRLAKMGNSDATRRLLSKYQYFVRVKAHSYFLAGGDGDDLLQEGYIGLFKAIRDYRADRAHAFRGFAELCVTRQIITAIKTASRQKHSPLNTYISFSYAPAGSGYEDRTLADLIPSGRTSDPVQQVISTGGTPQSDRLPQAPAEPTGSTGAPSLPGRAVVRRYRRADRARHQDGRQRTAEDQAQGPAAPRKSQGSRVVGLRRLGRGGCRQGRAAVQSCQRLGLTLSCYPAGVAQWQSS